MRYSVNESSESDDTEEASRNRNKKQREEIIKSPRWENEEQRCEDEGLEAERKHEKKV